jgi:hypothetical protein
MGALPSVIALTPTKKDAIGNHHLFIRATTKCDQRSCTFGEQSLPAFHDRISNEIAEKE